MIATIIIMATKNSSLNRNADQSQGVTTCTLARFKAPNPAPASKQLAVLQRLVRATISAPRSLLIMLPHDAVNVSTANGTLPDLAHESELRVGTLSEPRCEYANGHEWRGAARSRAGSGVLDYEIV